MNAGLKMEERIRTWITNFGLLIWNLEMTWHIMCYSGMSREFPLVDYMWQMMCHSCIVTPRVMETLLKSPKLQLSHKARLNQAPKVLNQIQRQRLKILNCWNCGPDGTFQGFYNFIKVHLSLILKHVLTLMICSLITQMYKNIGSQETIVSKDEMQLNVIRIPREDFPGTA
jgi:hypothetical protein